jgi:hypothetical protein
MDYLAIEERFKEMLDECYPTYEIAGVTLYPSQILEACDPVAYRIALSEYEDFEEQNQNA